MPSALVGVCTAMKTTSAGAHRRGGVGGEREPPLAQVALDDRVEARLVDRDLAALERGDLVGVLVGAHDLHAELGEARAGDEPDVAAADDADVHGVPLPSLQRSQALDGPAQAFVERDLRLEAEQVYARGRGRPGCGARRRRAPGRGSARRSSGDLLERREQLVQRDAAAAGDVDHVARRLRRVGREQVGAHGVGDEGEVAALLAVAVDARGLAAQARRREARHHGGVLALRILARSEHVEVAERDGLESVELVIEPAIDLARVLLERVRRARIRRHRLDLRQLLGVAVGRRRRREDHAPHARLARALEHVERAVDVGAIGARPARRRCAAPTGSRPRGTRRRRPRTARAAVAGSARSPRISSMLAERLREIRLAPAREVVEHAHAEARGEQAVARDGCR